MRVKRADDAVAHLIACSQLHVQGSRWTTSLGVDVHVHDTYFVVAHFHFLMVLNFLMTGLHATHVVIGFGILAVIAWMKPNINSVCAGCGHQASRQ